MHKEFNISRALPDAIREVTTGTVLGDYNKAIVCYDKPWWRNEGFNGYLASYSGPLTLARDTSVDEKGHYFLTCFVNGLPGRQWSKLQAHERRAAVLKQLSKVFKGNPENFRPIEVFDQIWQHQEFSRGALAPVHALGHLTKYALYMVGQWAIYILSVPSIALSGRAIWKVHSVPGKRELGRSWRLCRKLRPKSNIYWLVLELSWELRLALFFRMHTG